MQQIAEKNFGKKPSYHFPATRTEQVHKKNEKKKFHSSLARMTKIFKFHSLLHSFISFYTAARQEET